LHGFYRPILIESSIYFYFSFIGWQGRPIYSFFLLLPLINFLFGAFLNGQAEISRENNPKEAQMVRRPP